MGYLAFSIPALIAGVATTKYGLHSTALVYAAALAVLAAVAVAVLLARGSGRRPAPAAPATDSAAPAADSAAPAADSAAAGADSAAPAERAS